MALVNRVMVRVHEENTSQATPTALCLRWRQQNKKTPVQEDTVPFGGLGATSWEAVLDGEF